MRIRKVNISDAVGIAKVQVDTWKTAYKGIISDNFLQKLSYNEKTSFIKEWLKNLEKDVMIYVAEIEPPQIIGFAVSGLERTNNPIFKGELWGIYILQKYQRKGIGTSLVKTIVQKFLKRNIKSMIVWVLKNNPYRVFYENLGGKLVDEKTKQFGKENHKIVAFGWDKIENILKK
ncbi:MAG: GNAT family N-acetyltransferase [Promethearchaeota archaeon]